VKPGNPAVIRKGGAVMGAKSVSMLRRLLLKDERAAQSAILSLCNAMGEFFCI
jgi:hypothetical protein